ncbi:MAG: prepilin-type N-terminal cleavage/methylation domain-containing protein [Armatimonadia bacterium]|nr:prepilin-type N-terminal cleavage/methylation domain-containing protein [Armatimonadia bacterium]
MAKRALRMTSRAGSISRRRGRGIPLALRRGTLRRGFTITELMVVMVIMVLLAGLAVPQFVGSMRAERLRTAGRMVVSTAELARSRAVSEARLTRLEFDYENGRLTVYRYLQDAEQEQEPYWEPMTDNLAQARELPGGITIEYVGDDPDMSPAERVEELIFRPDGSSDQAFIVLEGYDEEILVVEVDDIRFMPRVLDVSSRDELNRMAPEELGLNGMGRQ